MKLTENIAVIDIGSNTIRLLVGKITNTKINRIFTDRVVTRLGKDIPINKKLNDNSIRKSIETIGKFKKISEQFQCKCIISSGTSALREAINSKEFCEKIKILFGLDVKVLSGEDEAYFTLEGIKTGLPYSPQNIFAVDIGGGSTEWIYEKKGKILNGSIDIGVLKAKDIEDFKKLIEEKIKKNLPKISQQQIFATGGTAVTLAMMFLELNEYIPEKIHLTEISIENLRNFINKISKLPVMQRNIIPGLPSDRTDIILPGLVILETICNFLNAKQIVVSDYGFMEGIMKNYKAFCYN